MGAAKLDIEFETEDSEKRSAEAKSNKTSKKFVELEFSIDNEIDSQREQENSTADDTVKTVEDDNSEEKLIQEAVKAESIQEVSIDHPDRSEAYGDSGPYQLGDILNNLIQKNKVIGVEFKAMVEIEASQRGIDALVEHAQNNKLLEYKINKILSQIVSKAPSVKKELIMIKRLLQEHTDPKKK